MSYLLDSLETKEDIDRAITKTTDIVLVLRFGRNEDSTCLQLDHLLAKCAAELANMAQIFIVDVDKVPVYTKYFDITLIPSTVFFFNAQHIKVDWGTPDHTKFVGSFRNKQDLIDVVEVIYRGAMKGKVIVTSPLDPANVPKYELIYKDI